MIKILIFVAGRDIHNLTPALNKFSLLYPKVNISVVGSTGVHNLQNVPFIPLDNISNVEFDFLLVTGGSDDINGPAADVHFSDILLKLRQLNISEDKVILDRVLCIPNFTFQKYEKLKKSKPTILAMHCVGGVIYHRFGLQFLSPIINMFLSDSDMIKILREPMKYMNSELKFQRWQEEKWGKYPVFSLGDDVILNMNHYGKLGKDIAKQKWEERKNRINWYNVIPFIYTSKPEILEELDSLPFAKKVCFVSFESDKDFAYYLDKKLDNNKDLWDLVNRFGLGYNQYNYDLWDMLLYGKKSYY